MFEEILSTHKKDMAIREKQIADQKVIELQRMTDAQIAQRVQHEQLQAVLLGIVKPEFTNAKEELVAAGYESFVTESKREGITGLEEITVTIELAVNGKKTAPRLGKPFRYSLSFIGDMSAKSIMAAADVGEGPILVPGVNNMAVGALNQDRVQFTLRDFVERALKTEAKL